MFIIGIKVKIYKVLIMFHMSFIGALISKASNILTITPEVIVESIIPKVFSTPLISAKLI
jgi:hypothetical protein